MKACIFDLDGVLVDTAKYHFIAWRRLANELGVDFDEHDNEQLKGLSRDASLDVILKKGNLSANGPQRQEWMDKKNAWYLELVHQMREDETLPNAKELLHQLKKAGIRIGLGSASKNAPLILERVGIAHLFDAVIDGTTTSKSKPDPEVFLLGASELGLKPEECIVFEDALSGIQAAKSGGFFAIGIGSPEVLKQADAVFPDLSELTVERLISLSKR